MSVNLIIKAEKDVIFTLKKNLENQSEPKFQISNLIRKKLTKSIFVLYLTTPLKN